MRECSIIFRVRGRGGGESVFSHALLKYMTSSPSPPLLTVKLLCAQCSLTPPFPQLNFMQSFPVNYSTRQFYYPTLHLKISTRSPLASPLNFHPLANPHVVYVKLYDAHTLYIFIEKATHPKNIINDQLFKLMSIFNDTEIVSVLKTFQQKVLPNTNSLEGFTWRDNLSSYM